jgi:hypothetical protein
MLIDDLSRAHKHGFKKFDEIEELIAKMNLDIN